MTQSGLIESLKIKLDELTGEGEDKSSSKNKSSIKLNRQTPIGEESLNEAKEEMKQYIDELMSKLDSENKKKFTDIDT